MENTVILRKAVEADALNIHLLLHEYALQGDYYQMQNVISDTRMRDSISKGALPEQPKED